MNVLQNELVRLREENARLKELLRKHGIAYEASTSPIVPTQKLMPQLSLEEKVALFRSLFRGREDVFARRWYSPKTEKMAISRYAHGNGIQYIATRRSINVRNVRIVS